MHTHFSRRAITASSVLIAGLLVATPPGAVVAADAVDNAPLLWLEGELTDSGGALPASFDPTGATTDFGLTLDAVLALSLGGRGGESAAVAALAAVEADINGYITGEAFGDTGSTYAGAVGKSMLAASIMGSDINDFGGVDLEARSRDIMETDGGDVGRFSDVSTFGNFSNGFGQALTVSALSFTPDGAPVEAVDFLLAQQCPNGAFRIGFDSTEPADDTVGCEDDAEASADATSLAVQALLTTGSAPATVLAIDSATAWLISEQAADGGVGANANSTGLASQAFLAAGETDAAELARAFVMSLQLSTDDSTAEAGAIGFDESARATAASDGIEASGRDQFRRATSQGALAYGVGPFGQIDDYTAATPERLFDTRDGVPIEAGAQITVQVTGMAGVPTNATAVALNVTAVRGAGVGFFTVWDCSDPRPPTSSVNFSGPAATPNGVISQLSDDGEICVYASEKSEIVIDISGYFSAGSDYAALTPDRLVDTRESAPISAGGQIEVQIGGEVGVPTNATAAALNVTAVRGAGVGFLSVWDCSDPRPTTSSVNFSGPAATPNSVISKLSADGKVCVYASAEVDVIVDVSGAFPQGSDYTGITPDRVIDTRAADPITGGGKVTVDVRGSSDVPDTAVAVALNVTAVRATDAGFLTVWDCSDTRPPTSAVNYSGPAATPNSVISKLSDVGEICVYSNLDVDVIVDVEGYFG